MLGFKLLFVFFATFSKLKFSSSNYVYQIFNGSLNNEWKMNFSIFSEEFNGMILLCIDSNNSYFKMEVVKGTGNEKLIKIHINKMNKVSTLLNLCRCNQCDKTRMTFNIRYNQEQFNVTCNNYNWETILTEVKMTVKNKNKTRDFNPTYPRPMTLFNTTNTMLIMIGNSGPYLSVDNTTSVPLKQQMIGCVDTLFYNDRQSELMNEGTKIKSSCRVRCTDRSCNGGMCAQISQDNFSCDCSQVAFNGRYCNNELRLYNRGDSHSYQRMEGASRMYLKMTWKQMFRKTYCLMEIIGKGTSYKMVNSSIVANINIDEIHFVIVNISKDYSYMKIKGNESRLHLLLDGDTRINVGFSERNASCEEFEGAYDLYYDYGKSIQNKKSVIKSQSTPTMTWQQLWVHFVSFVLFVFIANLGLAIVCVYCLRREKDMNVQWRHRNTKEEVSELQRSNLTIAERGAPSICTNTEYEDINVVTVDTMKDEYDYLPMSLRADLGI